MENLELQSHILVVDDENIVTSLIRDALEDEGYEIETASSGAAAIELADAHEFDLIITDIRMPRMDGIEMVQKIRATQPKIGIIFMTGYANLESAKNAIKQGASDYIMKPFELSEIRTAVHNALKMKRAVDETSSDHHLDHLTDLTRMLFEAGDRRGLIIASLRFAMIHQRAELGSVIFTDDVSSELIQATFEGDVVTERRLPIEPVTEVFNDYKMEDAKKPYVVNTMEDYTFWADHQDPKLADYFLPAWMGPEDHLIFVPVVRGGVPHCCMMIKLDQETIRLRETNLKFLFMVASQLAITLENLILLDQSRKAYARLKELQDSTIELEKMATRGELSASIGHEVNNFMGVMAGNLSLLEINVKKGEFGKIDKYVGNMNDTIEKVKTFTTSLMDLTPISSKRRIIKFDEQLKEVVEFLKPQKRYQDVSIHMRHMVDTIKFEADATQLQQMLYNIFNNAADAMIGCAKQTITLDLELTQEPDMFRFRITDTGRGIAPEMLEKVFREQFTTKKSGHGFGLMVCKQIIANHGGKLKVESVVDKGTSISILFPLYQKETEPTELQLV